ncbi:MAG: SAM-dependent chlorinase/fluorinase [Acidobacteriota bacterium]
MSVIALLTDFGETDYFVSSIKGVILKINPDVHIIDISHSVGSYNIKEAAFILKSCYKYFPERTIFICVVDPGVGSPRKIILTFTNNQYFIAPDNGILSFVLNENPEREIYEIKESKYFLPTISDTFHGRDVMAPVAAHLSRGLPLNEFGEKISDYIAIPFPSPKLIKKDVYEAEIIHVDKFGNLITSIPVEFIASVNPDKKLLLEIKGKKISRRVKSYFEGRKDELIFLVGSSNFLEIGINQESADSFLKARPGTKVKILIK